MASRITEFFGYAPADQSEQAVSARATSNCPFLGTTCTKKFKDGIVAGVCTLETAKHGPIICCPIRLYAADYKILNDVARAAFGEGAVLYDGAKAAAAPSQDGQFKVAVFGRRRGKELRLPNRSKGKGGGGFFVDWVLARLNSSNELAEFVAVEVQSIDTTGNYQGQHSAILNGNEFKGKNSAHPNWENVNKRILPQIIYKGHVIRREKLCQKGLFFVAPAPVYAKIRERLGGELLEYPLQPGTITFMWYDLGPEVESGLVRDLQQVGQMTTTVDNVALAFTSPSNLPDANVYEAAIKAELDRG